MMVDKSLIQVPTAICIVNCPVFSGRVEALCLEDPVCDVIIGNVPGALLVGESQVAKCLLGKKNSLLTQRFVVLARRYSDR